MAGAIVWASPPEDLPFYSEVYDPFWAAAQEYSIPLSLHEFAGFRWVDWESNAEAEATFATLILSGVLERFPGLKVVGAELNCGWLAHFLNRIDGHAATRALRCRRMPQIAQRRTICRKAPVSNSEGRGCSILHG